MTISSASKMRLTGLLASQLLNSTVDRLPDRNGPRLPHTFRPWYQYEMLRDQTLSTVPGLPILEIAAAI